MLDLCKIMGICVRGGEVVFLMDVCVCTVTKDWAQRLFYFLINCTFLQNSEKTTPQRATWMIANGSVNWKLTGKWKCKLREVVSKMSFFFFFLNNVLSCCMGIESLWSHNKHKANYPQHVNRETSVSMSEHMWPCLFDTDIEKLAISCLLFF